MKEKFLKNFLRGKKMLQAHMLVNNPLEKIEVTELVQTQLNSRH